MHTKSLVGGGVRASPGKPVSFARWFQARRARILALLGTIGYVLGLAARAGYVLGVHHPRHVVGSDAANLLEIARRLATT
jgi:hypothetical protein